MQKQYVPLLKPGLASFVGAGFKPALRYIPLLKPGLTASIVFSAVATAFATAGGNLPLRTLWMLTVAAFLSSSGSCAINHFLDRQIDGLMARTRNRPLPSGRIEHPWRVFWSGIALISLSLLFSRYYLNPLVSFYLFMGAFVYVGVYTLWLKKRSVINIVIGGAAGSFAVLAGGASVRPGLALPPLLVALIIFLWTPSHFWSFAIAKRDDYRSANIPMLPLIIGDKRAAWCILGNTLLLFLTSLLPYLLGVFAELYLAAAIITGAFFIFRNLQLIIHTTQPVALKNFKTSTLYLSVLLLSIMADRALLTPSI